MVLRDYLIYYYNRQRAIDFQNNSLTRSKALIFGNGPSLAGVLEDETQLSAFELFVCNGFALTDHYERLKPAHYTLLDPLYFDLKDSRVVDGSVKVIPIWEALIAKTTWPITLYTAQSEMASLEMVKEKYGTNPNISWVNLAPVKFRSNVKHHLYSKGIGLVGGMTVVHLSLQIAITKKYEEVYLCGVDLDWIENIRYEEATQKVYLEEKHFYDKGKHYYEDGIFKDWDLMKQFYSFYLVFKSFKDLISFSEYNGVKVYRGTKSLLDFVPYKGWNQSH